MSHHRFPLGTPVVITNPASGFCGRHGVIVSDLSPDLPHSAVLVRLLPDDYGPTLPCQLADVSADEEALPRVEQSPESPGGWI